MSQTYMTVKLNLPDGAIVYPQVSLDNVVNSIDDPTLATIATGISISVNGGTATLVTNGGSGVAKFVGANGLVVSMNEGNEVVFTAPTVSEVDSAAYADNAGSATHATSAGTADTLVSGYVVTSATNATSAGTAAAIASGAIVGGYKTEIVSGNTVGQMKWFNIVNTTGATVTVEPGEAYKINAANSAVTISATLGTASQWGQEGHAEIFVAGIGNVHTGANVTLANGLEPDSVNNCTLRFHDGKCIISVEDHVAGYIVTVSTGTTSGTLYYGLGTASEAYIAVDASLNGTTLDLGGAVTNGEKHIVGNGYEQTTLTGAVDCDTSKFTVANLALSDVQVIGGTMTLGDAFIPSGSTVAVSGGGLAVEKVTGAGSDSVIDLGGTNCLVGHPVTISGCKITGGSTSTNGGALNVSGGVLSCTDCEFSNNYADNRGRAIYVQLAIGTVSLTGCTVTGNGAARDIEARYSGSIFVNGGYIRSVNLLNEGNMYIQGSCSFNDVTASSGGAITISSGAVIDLTGNTNPTVFNAISSGRITFAPGGATVYPSAGQASAYMLGGMTVPKIGNTNVVNLNSQNVVISSGGTAYASGCEFTSGYNAISGGGLLAKENTILNLDDCIVSGCSGSAGGAVFTSAGGNFVSCTIVGNSGYGAVVKAGTDSLVLSSTTISGNSGTGGDIRLFGGTMSVIDCTLGSVEARTSISFAGNNSLVKLTDGGGSCVVTISSGAILDLTGNTNATPIAPGRGIVFESGGATVLYGDSAGTPTSSAIITGATVPALGNSANVVGTSATRSLFGNGTLTGVTFVQDGGDTWAPQNINYTLVNCAFSNGNMYLATGTTNDSTVTLSGSFVSNVNYTTFIIYQATGKGTLNILDNTTITVPNGADTKLCSNIGTVVVGSGCTINGNNLTPGTYSKCTITKNGTITEA